MALPEKIKGFRISHVASYLIIIGLFTWTALYLHHQDVQSDKAQNRAIAQSHHQCEVSNANAVSINKFIDALSDATLKIGAGNDQEIKDRVATYQASKAQIQKC